ncbi:carbohydrate binding domain-containing protein [Hymenobacter sp. BT186]|uniref:Carbohydrate binding domain-containing protein n=1 Tax=Hymenobacter telluris TaxID=2816474 RepID=A0A939JFX7_9BACT|nr:carbohydrate binding domain-containing protein [Hymenobacter telluris]MBO0360897.1 carbohydrate binding domain-containing protein [Hymenobacter telluris]MBW3376926.1 carbohydrate binding domain-containing protein [Hymenobacter norwichensis]
MKKLLYASLTLCLAACGDKAATIPANQLAGNDFESIEGWVGDNTPASLTKENAHSGRYSIKVDPAIEYSMGYSNLLGKLSASKLRKIKIKAWVYLPKGTTDAMLVTSVVDPADPSKPVLWDGFKLADQVKADSKWTEVEKEITLPDNISYTQKLGVYLWRTAAQGPAFMDDVIIEKAE